jgi:hypothetical protein
MLSRSTRKGWKPEEYRERGSGIFAMFDYAIKEHYRINDEEYNYIAEKLTEDELDLFISNGISFSERRQQMEIRKKYLREFYLSQLEKLKTGDPVLAVYGYNKITKKP